MKCGILALQVPEKSNADNEIRSSLPSPLFTKWLSPKAPAGTGIDYFVEKNGSQQLGLDLLKPLMADHFVGESTVLKLGGYEKAAAVLKNSLPTNKRTQSIWVNCSLRSM